MLDAEGVLAAVLLKVSTLSIIPHDRDGLVGLAGGLLGLNGPLPGERLG